MAVKDIRNTLIARELEKTHILRRIYNMQLEGETPASFACKPHPITHFHKNTKSRLSKRVP